MKILMAASEIIPFAKSGGLADVLGSLPAALAKLGHDVKVFMPFYSFINKSNFRFIPVLENLPVPVNDQVYNAHISRVRLHKSNVEIYFIGNEKFFKRDNLYVDNTTGKDYTDNDLRFIFFSKAVLEFAKHINWQPNIINAHDWQSALMPVYLKTTYKNDSFFAGTKTVFTVHNLAYQGTFEAEKFKNLNLPVELFGPTSPLEFYGKVNFLKGAVVFADKITTVSENYAREIQSNSILGCGLDGVLTQRNDDLVGILNGVDYTVWSPSRDKYIPHTYYRANLSGKRICKVELLNQMSMPHREDSPLIGIISRLVAQKGIDLIMKTAEKIFKMDTQIVLLGTGEEVYHKYFNELQAKYPDKFKAYLTFDDVLAHKIEAASDIFLMPSKFEPCGLNQMYSLKYGTIPVVHKVGGLADTVVDFDENTQSGNGFVFDKYTPEDMLKTMERALEIYRQKRLWIKIMKTGMALDYSWNNSAKKYIKLFNSIIS